MSSSAVRTLFRNELTNWLAANEPTVPFHETINTHADPKEDLWVTLDFVPEYSEELTIGCDDKGEYGSVDIYCYGRAGKGDAAVLTLAENIVAGLRNINTGGIMVEAVEPPQETFGTDVNRWFGIVIGLDYIAYT